MRTILILKASISILALTSSFYVTWASEKENFEDHKSSSNPLIRKFDNEESPTPKKQKTDEISELEEALFETNDFEQGKYTQEFFIEMLGNKEGVTPQDYKDNKRLILDYLKRGNINAKAALGILELYNNNFSLGFDFLKKAIREGHRRAETIMVGMLADMSPSNDILGQVSSIIDRQAQLGNIEAMYLKDLQLDRGISNINMLKAAQGGNVQAQYRAGFYNLEGRFPNASLLNAIYWFTLAANQHYDGASQKVEELFIKSPQLTIDPQVNLMLDRLSNESNLYATILLGTFPLFNELLNGEAINSSLLYLEKAGALGSIKALGCITYTLVNKDFEDNVWFEKYLPFIREEADKYNPIARTALGIALAKGLGKLGEKETAETYLQEAIQANIGKASYYYALLLLEKKGNFFHEAVYHFNKSLQDNFNKGRDQLSRLLVESPQADSVDFITSFDYLSLEASQGSLYAQCSLSIMKCQGWELALDPSKGLGELFELYDKHNFLPAGFYLWKIFNSSHKAVYQLCTTNNGTNKLTERWTTKILLHTAEKGYQPAKDVFDQLVLNSQAFQHPLFDKKKCRVEKSYTTYTVPQSPEGFLIAQLKQTLQENERVADNFTLFNGIATATGEVFERTREMRLMPPTSDGLRVKASPNPAGAAQVGNYVWALQRLQQLETAPQPLYINLYRVIDDKEQAKYFAPLSQEVKEINDMEWLNIKNKFLLWLSESHDQSLSQNFLKWWEHINFNKDQYEKGILRKRVKRIYDTLDKLDRSTQFTYVASMSGAGEACNQRALRGLTQLESDLINHMKIEVESLPFRIDSLFGKYKLDVVTKLSKRPDHRGVVEEDRLYLVLLQNLLSLPVYEGFLSYPDEVYQCLKLKNALLAFYEEITVEKLLNYFYENLKNEMTLFEKEIISRKGISLEKLSAEERSKVLGEVYAEFTTEDFSEVRKDYIEKLLIKRAYVTKNVLYNS